MWKVADTCEIPISHFFPRDVLKVMFMVDSVSVSTDIIQNTSIVHDLLFLNQKMRNYKIIYIPCDPYAQNIMLQSIPSISIPYTGMVSLSQTLPRIVLAGLSGETTTKELIFNIKRSVRN